MIKEIEVGGVKHSITLADDMVGPGLKIVEGGRIIVNTGSGIIISSGNTLEVNVGGLVGSGLFASGGRINLNVASVIAPDKGLFIHGGALAISGEVASRILAGAGLIANSGLLKANVNTGSGIFVEENKILVKVAYRSSGLRLFFNSNGELDVTQN